MLSITPLWLHLPPSMLFPPAYVRRRLSGEATLQPHSSQLKALSEQRQQNCRTVLSSLPFTWHLQGCWRTTQTASWFYHLRSRKGNFFEWNKWLELAKIIWSSRRNLRERCWVLAAQLCKAQHLHGVRHVALREVSVSIYIPENKMLDVYPFLSQNPMPKTHHITNKDTLKGRFCKSIITQNESKPNLRSKVSQWLSQFFFK